MEARENAGEDNGMYKTFLAILSVLILSGCAGSKKSVPGGVDLNTGARANSFAIMPFEEPETYPYASDRMREALIIAFMHKGYQVQTNPVLWDSLAEQSNVQLYNLNEKQARKVANKLKVDLLIFGHSDFRSGIMSTRSEGMYEQRTVEKPIVIKAYDLKTDTILLRERISTKSFWGLNPTEKDYRTMAIDFVNKLQTMGYIE
jgi:hypothetical protein